MDPGFPEGRFTIACIIFGSTLFDKTTPTNGIEHNSVISKDKQLENSRYSLVSVRYIVDIEP